MVQLLIHGASYTHIYFDFGNVDGIRYSYARDVAAAGIPTFAIDQLGAGNSSQPPSSDITIQVAAYADHQVVQALLSGAVGGVDFGKVIEVGHSFGSIAGLLEAATYHDVAGVILTGDGHSQASFPVQAEQDLYPAINDPMFANSGLDPGYLTTVPGTRGFLFYNLRDADPAVITADEASKGAISGTEFGTGLPLQTSSITSQITAPVLIIDGQDDQIICGPQIGGGTYDCSSGAAIAQQEAPYYAAAAQLRACAVPNSGHDIALALNHLLQEADAVAWSLEYVGGLPSRILPRDCSS
jgi:pimeloyl-ACP methyl ester carboxylesterase